MSRRVRQAKKELSQIEQNLEQTLERSPTVSELSKQIDIKESKVQRLKERISFIDIDDDSTNEEISNNHNHDDNLHEFFIERSISDPMEKIYLNEVREIIWQEVENLPKKERTVMILYYLFDLPMLKIGNIMDYTESRICQIHGQAIILLQEKTQKYNF